MGDRRTLTQGLKDTPKVDAVVAREFIYGKEPAQHDQQTSTLAASPKPAPVITRTAFSTRIRDDLAKALKEASLKRQLSGVTPNTVQDILEEALEPWLKKHGYLT